MIGLHLLSAGAAQAVATPLAREFRAATGVEVHASFLAVGALKEALLAGESCDVVVSTAAMLGQFSRDARVDVFGTKPNVGITVWTWHTDELR